MEPHHFSGSYPGLGVGVFPDLSLCWERGRSGRWQENPPRAGPLPIRAEEEPTWGSFRGRVRDPPSGVYFGPVNFSLADERGFLPRVQTPRCQRLFGGLASVLTDRSGTRGADTLPSLSLHRPGPGAQVQGRTVGGRLPLGSPPGEAIYGAGVCSHASRPGQGSDPGVLSLLLPHLLTGDSGHSGRREAPRLRQVDRGSGPSSARVEHPSGSHTLQMSMVS